MKKAELYVKYLYTMGSEASNITVYEEHGILLYRRDRTMVAYGKIFFEA